MKQYTLFLIAITFISSGLNRDLHANYKQNAIAIKPIREYFINHDKVSINFPAELKTALNAYLSSYETRTYLSPNALIAYEKTVANINNSLRFASSPLNLSNIFIIEYKSNIDPLLVSQKLMQTELFEFAEPLYERNLVEIPNDPHIIWQYYLETISAYEAWDHLPDGFAELGIKIGIVDTGIDYTHEDLSDNIWTNPGESGLDLNGNPRESNGIDDDGNGFIDDWRGWDFVAGDGSTQDNDPIPGNSHGTHVAGTAAAVSNNSIGIAGVFPQAKLIAIKVGPDDPEAASVANAYSGLLYAATLGADVINCSWGGSGYSQAESEIILAAEELGSIIVAAAGNNSSLGGFYPASYPNIISVAATDAFDVAVGFTNYDFDVDIAAPGLNIFSTIPAHKYGDKSGTSMASPIVAAVAGMVLTRHPEYNAKQMTAHLMMTADSIPISDLVRYDKLGAGRVNALRAVRDTPQKGIYVEKTVVVDENGDGYLEANEKVEVFLELRAVLGEIDNLNIRAYSTSFFPPVFELDFASLGTLSEGETIETPPFSFTVPSKLPYDYILEVKFDISDGSEFLLTSGVSLQANPTFAVIESANLEVTITSEGNLAYADFPRNTRGKGMHYKSSNNLLFEAALMIATSDSIISNSARVNRYKKDSDFKISKVIKLDTNTEVAYIESYAEYSDQKYASASDTINQSLVGVSVNQSSYHFADSDYFIIEYEIKNENPFFLDSLFVGLYLDWDIGTEAFFNMAEYDRFAYSYHPILPDAPMMGIDLISRQGRNFFAIDNEGNDSWVPEVYNDFTSDEKWRTMASGIARVQSDTTDISMTFAAGPSGLPVGDSMRVAFAIMAGSSYAELDALREQARESYESILYSKDKLQHVAKSDALNIVFPNPNFDGTVTAQYELASDRLNVSLGIYDLAGKLIMEIERSNMTYRGKHEVRFDLSNIAIGTYQCVLKADGEVISEKFIVIK